MNIYHYSEQTGEYLETTVARPDPLDPQNYLIPRNATSEPLPQVGTGQRAIFNGVSWNVVPDYRGEVVHNVDDQSQLVWSEPGELPEGFALGELPPNFTILRTQQKQHIDAARITAENTEFIFAHNGSNWDGGKASKYRLQTTLDAVTQLGELPEGFFWTDADNIDHTDITIAQLQALLAAMDIQMLQRGFTIHATKRTLVAAIAAAPDDVAAIRAIVWPV